MSERRSFTSAESMPEARALQGLGWRRADGRMSGPVKFPLPMEWFGDGEPKLDERPKESAA